MSNFFFGLIKLGSWVAARVTHLPIITITKITTGAVVGQMEMGISAAAPAGTAEVSTLIKLGFYGQAISFC